jgi:hypothetical protein
LPKAAFVRSYSRKLQIKVIPFSQRLPFTFGPACLFVVKEVLFWHVEHKGSELPVEKAHSLMTRKAFRQFQVFDGTKGLVFKITSAKVSFSVRFIVY